MACLLPAIPTWPLTLRWLASLSLGMLEPGREPVSSSGAGEQTCDPLFLQEEHREARLTLRPPSLAAPYAPVQSWQHQPEKLIFESCGYEANVSCPGRLGLQCSSLLLRPALPAPGGEGGSQLAWEKGIGRKSRDWSQMGWVTPG